MYGMLFYFSNKNGSGHQYLIYVDISIPVQADLPTRTFVDSGRGGPGSLFCRNHLW